MLPVELLPTDACNTEIGEVIVPTALMATDALSDPDGGGGTADECIAQEPMVHWPWYSESFHVNVEMVDSHLDTTSHNIGTGQKTAGQTRMAKFHEEPGSSTMAPLLQESLVPPGKSHGDVPHASRPAMQAEKSPQ